MHELLFVLCNQPLIQGDVKAAVTLVLYYLFFQYG
jgi:hypothetical protein